MDAVFQALDPAKPANGEKSDANPEVSSDADVASAVEIDAKCGLKPPSLKAGPEAVLKWAGLDGKTVERVLKIGKKVNLSDRFGLIARIQKAELLDTNLGNLIGNLATLDPGAESQPDDKATRLALGAINMIEALRDITDATVNPPRTPSPSALLIAKQFQAYQLKVARAKLARAKAKRKLLQTRQEVLEIEALQLAETLVLAERSAERACAEGKADLVSVMQGCKASPAARSEAARALALYGKSWVEGRLPGALAQYELVHVDRQANLALSKENAEAKQAIITTSLNELKRWGEGGITSNQVIGLLQALGIGAIAATN